jgi:hypothetical protein
MSNGSGVRNIVAIYKNGSAYLRVSDGSACTSSPASSGGVLIDMNGSTDYIELYVYSLAASPSLDAFSSGAGTILSGSWIRS